MPFNIPLSTAKRVFSAPRCALCTLHKKCKSPKMAVDGFGKKKILIVGEAPGENEDEKNRPFVGKSGQYLEEVLDDLGINMREDCWITNAIRCHPKDNRTPTTEEISYCYPYLKETISFVNPNVIITLGRAAIESVLTESWEEEIGTMTRWVGWKIPHQRLNTYICPTYHPSYVLREMNATKMGSPITTIFRDHLDRATKITKQPYTRVPDYKIEVQMDTAQAAKTLEEFIEDGGPIAFDYETNCLKPDKDGVIVAASVCWRGKRTIAFPFYGSEVRRSWQNLMNAPNPKIAHNIKFEYRWTQQKFKRDPVNCDWDTMIAAHLLDNRKGICSLGFQTFVMLGVHPYYSDVGKYLEQKESYLHNRVKEAKLERLLEYCGMDSLLTYKLAVKQRKLLKMEVW